MKQIMIVGAGSVGGYFGAYLARKHSNVSFLLRPKTQIAVAKNGLRIRSAIGESFTVHPPSSSNPQHLPQPDLIILDIMMPKMDGYEVLRRLRNDKRTRHLPILMLTARGETNSIMQSEELGATDYLIKPYEPEELLSSIKRYLPS